MILAAQLALGTSLALFDSGAVNFLHLTIAKRAIAGVFDAVTEVVKIGTKGTQRADQGFPRCCFLVGILVPELTDDPR